MDILTEDAASQECASNLGVRAESTCPEARNQGARAASISSRKRPQKSTKICITVTGKCGHSTRQTDPPLSHAPGATGSKVLINRGRR